MQLLKIYYAYFSPGNTTEKVVSHIASSFQNYPVESINLTDYATRQEDYYFKENELLIIASFNVTLVYYAQNAKFSGLDGVVCSPLEAGMVKENCSKAFMTVTPGVRFADGDVGDQVRVTTPAKAKEIGSDYIVVGRPITASDDPVSAYRRCVKEFVG